ncbi:alpha-rhamnosidase [Siphonobacter sp. BAB-5385]|uniref:alpha-L-rhamnosidase n=1 Tax=Siphonobacter sp. BAB-5385 TaxID=1864822 RepID=UPI000B9E6DA9|nr:alpha-L-rhamnosidase [Siphonobacter sp. BAB-5385]OZI09351.1 alpha-rhamnosidase [Siphonobacter sp. BAB-5385]
MKSFLTTLLVGSSTFLYAQQGGNLTCEHLKNPLGIDAPQPRFNWHMEDSRPGARQTAYQLFVSTDSVQVQKTALWQSGKITSGLNQAVYKGPALKPYTKYYWAVVLWDQDGKVAPQSSVASFETGLMNQLNWKGSWISDSRDSKIKPAPYFRKAFQTTKKIRSARAYVAAAGLYELFINGQKVGNHRLDPMYTRFDRRTLYVTYDVTKQLQEGKNAIGILLGNGWYNHQSTAVWYFDQAPWRSRPSFCLDVRVTYEDGSTETISSDTSWKTALSPIVFNSIYTAEHYDARLEQAGWNTADFDDSKWKNVMNRPAPSQHIVAQALHPIRNVEEIRTASLVRINDTTWVYNMGRNIAGVSELKVKGKSGTVVRLKHGERLYENGRVDLSNIDAHYRPTDNQDPFQTDIVTLSGREDTFMPRFNYKGFQYVEVTSQDRDLELTPASLTAYFMHSDVPPIGQVQSSNPTLDKIWSATNNAYLSNLFGYPTDCPQREKNGWTGDGQIAIETGLYSFDGITIYEKWLADHRDEQQANGVLPAIIPTSGWGYDWANGPDWTSTIAVIPWNLYLFYGDAKPLSDNYENIKRYVDHITEIAPSGLTTWGLGDWVPVKSKSPVELTSSIYYFVDATILSKAAGLLNKTEDQARYAALAKKIQDAINAKYLNSQTGMYGSGLQTELAVPLQWGVVPENLKAKVADNLAKRVKADGNALDVGLLGTKAILNALSENGHADVAYTLASNEKYPSWGWWIKNGATTLYENWDIQAKSDISLNHIMFGEIGAWIYKGLGGIKPDPTQPGFKNVLLRPNFVAGLEQFEAQHEGPYGRIVSSWKRTGKTVEYKVSIPANSTASVFLKGKKVMLAGKPVAVTNPSEGYKVGAGNHTFVIEE